MDLFSSKPSSTSKPLSVSDLNTQIKSQLETKFGRLLVKAEISNFKAHTSGHFYFTLKDSQSQISSVMFRGQTSKLNFRPKDGLEVLVKGRVSVYSPRGNYQILCESMEPIGSGGLKEQFEQLKRKLNAEGLFDQASKKTLPYLPFKIALVTSPTGAAVRDMLNVLSRKHPGAELIVVPAMTQGVAAAKSLIESLDLASKIKDLDVILLARGGGSLEDLFCFNDEALARKIFSLNVPVISGVGHEIDFTIADFVSDYRAPTPSVAAEIVCKNIEEIKERFEGSKRRLYFKLKNDFSFRKQALGHFSKRLIDPRKKLDDKRLKVEDLNQRAIRAIKNKINQKRSQLSSYTNSESVIKKEILVQKNKVEALNLRLTKTFDYNQRNKVMRYENMCSKLRALSPFSILDRGYSVVYSEYENKIIRSNKELKAGDELKIRFSKGFVKTNVTKSYELEEAGSGKR